MQFICRTAIHRVLLLQVSRTKFWDSVDLVPPFGVPGSGALELSDNQKDATCSIGGGARLRQSLRLTGA